MNPDLITRDEAGRPTTVRYEAVNAMLLNEFLKEHRQVEEQQSKLQQQMSKAREQETRLTEQEALIAQQQKQIEALSAGLQQVTARVESNQTAPRVVSDN